MPTVVISPVPVQQFFINGIPAAGGLLFTYLGGTSTKTPTYTDSTGTVANANPIILNANGESPNIWLPPQQATKFVLAPAGDTDPPSAAVWTIDNVSAAVVTGAATFTSLTVSGTTNLGFLNAGATTLASVIVTGSTSLSTLVTSGLATLGSLTVNGTTTISPSSTLNTGPITASGNITMTTAVPPTAAADSVFISSAPSGFNATYVMQNTGSPRWDIKKNNTAEGGTAVGSDFSIDSYDNTGTYLDTPILITRSTSIVSFSKGIIVTAGTSSIGSITNFNAAVNIQAGATVTTDRGLKFTSATNSAGAGAGTLGNAPNATNPDFWCKISINGSNYSFPCWLS